MGLALACCGGAGAARPQRAMPPASEDRTQVAPPPPGPGDDAPARARAGDAADAPPAPAGHALEGLATWYGPGFAGRRTANGERFDPGQLTAAHRTLPFGTRVRVVAERTGDSVVVRINDRGPFGHEDRIIDLARGAARRIGLDRAGVMRVRLEVVEEP